MTKTIYQKKSINHLPQPIDGIYGDYRPQLDAYGLPLTFSPEWLAQIVQILKDNPTAGIADPVVYTGSCDNFADRVPSARSLEYKDGVTWLLIPNYQHKTALIPPWC